MALQFNTSMTDLGMKPGHFADRTLAAVIKAHAEATWCAVDAQRMLTTGEGYVLDMDAWRCALLCQSVAAAELLIRGCTVGYGAEGQALVTEPADGVYPRTASVKPQAPPRRLFRVYLRGMTSTDVLVEATSEGAARKAARLQAEEASFDWGGVEIDTTSTEAEEIDLAELNDEERAQVIIEAGR